MLLLCRFLNSESLLSLHPFHVCVVSCCFFFHLGVGKFASGMLFLCLIWTGSCAEYGRLTVRELHF